MPWYTNMKCNLNNCHNNGKISNYDNPMIKMFIDLDEPFPFTDTMSKCSTPCHDILFYPKDIYNIAKELHLKPKDVVSQYCEGYIGPYSRVPFLRPKSVDKNGKCPFLGKDNKCLFNDAKPMVCAMYPLDRGKDADGNIRYFFKELPQYEHPNASVIAHNPRKWIETHGVNAEDKYLVQWNEMIDKISSTAKDLEKKKTPDKYMQRFYLMVTACACIQYNIKKDFLPQFKHNMKKLSDYLYSIELGYYEFCQAIGD